MRDRLRGGEGRRHNAAEQVILGTHAEFRRGVQTDERVARDQIQRFSVSHCRTVRARKLKPLQLRKLCGNRRARHGNVFVEPVAKCVGHDDTGRACTTESRASLR